VPPVYSICALCCLDGDDEQTEECVSRHQHGKAKPICETIALLDEPRI